MHPGKIVPKLFIYLFAYLFMWMTSFLNNLNLYSYFSLNSYLSLFNSYFTCLWSTIVISKQSMFHSQD